MLTLWQDPGNALTFLNEQAATLATNLEGLYSALLPRIAFSDTHLYHASHGLDFVARCAQFHPPVLCLTAHAAT